MEKGLSSSKTRENILLSKPVEELNSLCRNEEYYEICSSPSFWMSYFEKRGLAILKKGVDFKSWYNLYLASREAKQIATIITREMVEGVARVTVPLYKVQDPKIIEIEEIDLKAIEEFLEVARLEGEVEEAERELKELEREYGDVIADAYRGGSSSEELNEIMERMADLREFVQQTEERAYLSLYEENDKIVYQLWAEGRLKREGTFFNERVREKKLTFIISPEELENLLYRLAFFGLV